MKRGLLRHSPTLWVIMVLVLNGVTGQAWAIRPDEVLTNPVLEARARAIGSQLRCLVCQNESIDDSDADLAHDLRLLVRKRLLAGDTDEQVKQYMVDRYGTYVLLKPPFNREAAFLWIGPFVFLVSAAAVVAIFYSRNALREAKPVELTSDESSRLAALMSDDIANSGGA